MKKPVIKIATPEQIKQWKAQYGQLTLIKIPVGNGETAEFIARLPNKNEMQALASKEDTTSYNELMFNIMLLAGDRKYIDDTPDFVPAVYLGLVKELGKLYTPPESASISL